MKRNLPPYVERRKGRKGQTYHYFRRRGWSVVRIYSEPGTPEFAAEYARILNGAPPPPPGRAFRALIASYKRSRRFARLAPRTKQDYDRVLAFLDDRLGKLPADKMQKKDVVRLRDTNADTVRFANYCVQILKVLFDHACEQGWRADNPAKGVQLLESTADPRKPWPQDMIDAYRAAADGRALLIFELCLGTGQRIGDVLRMRWDQIEDAGVHVRQGKTRKPLWVPFTRRLAAVLANTPRDGLTIITGRAGRPLSYRQASHAVMQVRKQIGAEEYDLHGLRHAAAAELAALGCSDELIEAVTGHQSRAMVAHYAGAARQRTRAKEAQEKRK
jgi:integrase